MFNIIKKTLFTLILITHMCVIFCFSMQPAENSGEQSKSFTIKILNVIPVICEKSIVEKTAIAENIDFYIRKCAHFSIYAILGFIAFFTFSNYSRIKNHKYVYILAFCFLYAISDEIHQYFVPGRACRIYDVCIDFIGSICGMCIACKITKFIIRRGENNGKFFIVV